ncbi:MAG: SGNH/GDSL hydrolase family protein, partial [Elusimicrobia bacterium]|nr:SGNH/GDSL hydrolase family protein [Elusimicrobiota bacterium]
MNARVRRASARLAVLLTACVAGVALAEAILAARGVKPGWRVQSADSWAQDEFYARYTLKPGVYPNLFGCSARIDSLGARGPEPRRPEVLSLGDSCTFGVGLREPESYPGWLSAHGVETVNAGVPGYNTETALEHLRHSSLLALHPKLVTIYFGW